MRILIIFLLSVTLLSCGCQQPSQTSSPPSINVEVHPLPQVPPTIPVEVSFSYKVGYIDGYHGRLLSIRWATWDYRQGWELGHWERIHNLPQRFR